LNTKLAFDIPHFLIVIMNSTYTPIVFAPLGYKLLILLTALVACSGTNKRNDAEIRVEPLAQVFAVEHLNSETDVIPIDSTARTIHVFVALCDNQYQGIVPVPKGIGNGQDPATNLYWGCGYGIRTFFKKSAEWKLVKTEQPDSLILERLLFKHVSKPIYLLADAYNGKYIEQCTQDFLRAASGDLMCQSTDKEKNLAFGGHAELLAYIGHDGLMDFQITDMYLKKNDRVRSTIVLACFSKHYFSPHLKQAGANPLVWTTGLMAPEAYTLHDALTGYVNGENAEAIRTRAAKAYSKYQKCSEKAARNLLVTGW
jgi:hypothetical protein